jgi:hypothetical protein
MDDKTTPPTQTDAVPPARPNNSRSRIVSDEKSEARELWFKTVVKVLKWKEGFKGKQQPTISEMITDKEWTAYYKETIKINSSTSKDKTLKKLKDTEELIRKHGGFAS